MNVKIEGKAIWGVWVEHPNLNVNVMGFQRIIRPHQALRECIERIYW